MSSNDANITSCVTAESDLSCALITQDNQKATCTYAPKHSHLVSLNDHRRAPILSQETTAQRQREEHCLYENFHIGRLRINGGAGQLRSQELHQGHKQRFL
mgnify:CR=1 FL=1